MFDASICSEYTRSNQLIVLSIYVSIDYTQRKSFFKKKFVSKINILKNTKEAIIIIKDINDFELSALDCWSFYEKIENKLTLQ
jgi:hypothetical protein